MTHDLISWKRQNQALDNLNRSSRPEDRGPALPGRQRIGTAKITALGAGAGEYTVTVENYFDGTWHESSGGGGFVDLGVRDFRGRDFGQVGQRVLFWTQGDLDGCSRVWIDVTSRPFIAVQDDQANQVDQAFTLRVSGDNGLSSGVSQVDGQTADLTLSLPGGLYGGDLLRWNNTAGQWQVLQVASTLENQIPWLAEADDLRWVQPFFSTLGVSGESVSGVAHLYLHQNDLQNSTAGPIRLSQESSGTFPGRSVQVVVSHDAPHVNSQSVTVSDAAGTGTVTLEFDRHGHFQGVS
jgi:hypothetical protein